MPELPEVEMYQRYIEQTSFNQKIIDVEVLHPKVTGGPGDELKVLVDDSFVDSKRWGKNLFLITKKNRTLFMHFGMTGNMEYYNTSLEVPKYARVIFHFDEEFDLAYVSKRMFGRIGLVNTVDDFVQSKSLGKDSLEISDQEFRSALATKNKNIKAALLDQTVSAGVGNWIADEILFQSRIYPTVSTKLLNEHQIQSIYENMQEVMSVAIEVDAVREGLPPHYITHYGRKAQSIDCPRCKSEIEKTEVGGRGTYACSNCQLVQE